jgi:6-phosphogluconate dehydrogenase
MNTTQGPHTIIRAASTTRRMMVRVNGTGITNRAALPTNEINKRQKQFLHKIRHSFLVSIFKAEQQSFMEIGASQARNTQVLAAQ